VNQELTAVSCKGFDHVHHMYAPLYGNSHQWIGLIDYVWWMIPGLTRRTSLMNNLGLDARNYDHLKVGQ